MDGARLRQVPITMAGRFPADEQLEDSPALLPPRAAAA
jgi:hypothetical protein